MITMTRILTLTDAHIALGVRDSTESCPFALAGRWMFGAGVQVDTMRGEAYLWVLDGFGKRVQEWRICGAYEAISQYDKRRAFLRPGQYPIVRVIT